MYCWRVKTVGCDVMEGVDGTEATNVTSPGGANEGQPLCFQLT